MSSGARWCEDYADPASEISRMGLAFAPGGSLDTFMSTIVREYEPGTACQYSSGDSRALGMLLRAATASTGCGNRKIVCQPEVRDIPF